MITLVNSFKFFFGKTFYQNKKSFSKRKILNMHIKIVQKERKGIQYPAASSSSVPLSRKTLRTTKV